MNKRLLLIGVILTILFAIPLTLYLLTTSQVTTLKAAPSTSIDFVPSTKTVNVGDTVKFDFDLNPANGGSPNTITFINLKITFDADSLEAAPGVGQNSTGIVINQYKANDGTLVNFVPLEQPSISCSNQCVISLSLGVNPSNPINQIQHAFLSLSLHTKKVPDTGTAQVKLDGSKVLSIGANDTASDNVLNPNPPNPATITITALTPTPTQATTPTPTNSPTPTTDNGGSSGGSSGGSGSSGGAATQQLTCSALTADNTSSTSAPLAVLFSASGTASTGVINKVTFNFGDGAVQDVTSAGGIGTAAVNSQISHTYKTTGTFTATATLTGDSGAISNPSSCSQTITVGTTAASGTTPTPTTKGGLAATGPGETVLMVGLAGAVIAAIGGLLVFGL